MREITIVNRGNIWYSDECCYLNEETISIGTFNDNCFWDFRKWLELEHSVKYDNCCFLNNGETKHVYFSSGKSVIITGCDAEQTEVVAVVNTTNVSSFEFFDDMREFEIFYHDCVSKITELLQYYKEQEDDNQ